MTHAVLAALLLAVAQDRSPESLYQEAWYREIAETRVNDALEIYEGLAARAELPAPFRAKALFRAGVCLRKLQKQEGARAAFDRLLKDFAQVTDVAEAARREIAGETEEEAGLRRKAESLIARLGDKDEKAREEARHNLASLGPRVAPYVLAALGGADFIVSQEAATVLVSLSEQDSSLAATILSALRSGDDAVRGHFRRALWGDDTKAIDAAIVAWLADPSPQVRAIAVRALGGRKGAAAIETFEKLLADPDREVRLGAVEAVSRVRGRQGPWLRKAFADPDAEVREAAVRFTYHEKSGPLDVEAVLTRLGDDSRAVVSWAVKSLLEHQKRLPGKVKVSVLPAGDAGTQAIAALGRLAADAAFDARQEALALLSFSSRREALPWVEKLLGDSDRVLAEQAVRALAEVGGPAAAPALMDLLTDPRLGSAAWVALSNNRWLALGLERLVERLPEVHAAHSLANSSRAAVILGTAADSQRTDLILAALRHYDALDIPGKVALLQFLRRTGARQEWLPAVLKGLNEPDNSVKGAALSLAAELGDPRVAPGLIACLESFEAQVRFTAASLLRTLGDQRAVPALLARLADPDGNVASNAAEALERLADRSAVGPILDVLRRQDLAQPRYALQCLGKLAAPEDAAAIGAALPGLSPPARVDVLHMLGRLGSETALPAVQAELASDDPAVREAAVRALDAIGGDGVLDAIVRALADPESKVRKAAAEALAKQDRTKAQAHPQAITSLIAVLDDPDWEARSAALDALAAVGDARAVPALLEALRTGDSRVRPATAKVEPRVSQGPGPHPVGPNRRPSMASRARDVLERLGDRGLVAPMLAILTEPTPRNDWLLPCFARDLLAAFATAEDAPAITQAVGRVPPELRPELVTILASLPDTDPAATAGSFLGDDDERVRKVVADALGRSKDPRASSLLTEALGKETAQDVLTDILWSLGRIADPAAIPAVLECLKRQPRIRTTGLETLLRYPGAEVLKAVTTVLETAFPEEVQWEAVLVLGRIDHPGAVPLLLKQLSSTEELIRKNAALALGDTYDPRALPRLLDALRDPAVDVRSAAREAIDKIRFDLETRKLAAGAAPAAAGAQGAQGATAELVRQLADESPAVRAAAARSLGRLRAREALPTLVRARKDGDAGVRNAVEEALDAIAAEKAGP